MSYTWNEYPDASTTAEALAQAVADMLRQTLSEKPYAVLAVSGGRSPIAFFQALSQQDLAWERIKIGLVDERLVPVAHADSNSALVQQYLLCNRAAAAEWLPMVANSADETALSDRQTALNFALAHYIQPDVAVLGMGADGHTASLFPNSETLTDGLNIDYPQPLIYVVPPIAPHNRLSMTLAAIQAARGVFLAISGAEKQAVFAAAAPQPDRRYPISYVLNSPKINCHVYFSQS